MEKELGGKGLLHSSPLRNDLTEKEFLLFPVLGLNLANAPIVLPFVVKKRRDKTRMRKKRKKKGMG